LDFLCPHRIDDSTPDLGLRPACRTGESVRDISPTTTADADASRPPANNEGTTVSPGVFLARGDILLSGLRKTTLQGEINGVLAASSAGLFRQAVVDETAANAQAGGNASGPMPLEILGSIRRLLSTHDVSLSER
jgi:hypothetical protein